MSMVLVRFREVCSWRGRHWTVSEARSTATHIYPCAWSTVPYVHSYRTLVAQRKPTMQMTVGGLKNNVAKIPRELSSILIKDRPKIGIIMHFNQILIHFNFLSLIIMPWDFWDILFKVRRTGFSAWSVFPEEDLAWPGNAESLGCLVWSLPGIGWSTPYRTPFA